ncbi:MAG: LysR family transcriptional regulator [Clostridia bacterium]|nr:LysR family transcriptional regulator [Clostridia bacterium]
MDLRVQEYVVAIQKYGNMTEAAEKLFITPSALNQQLLKLEKELGMPLFTRSKRKMTPTAAGLAYLEGAHHMLAIRQEVYTKLQDMAECVTGSYRIGLTYDHGSSVFARIYSTFHRQYPGIQMRCFQMLVPEMLEQLEKNELDIVFLLGGCGETWPGLDTMPLSEENLLLGVPRMHPLAKNAPFSDKPLPAFDLRLLKDEPFSLALKKSTMRSQLVDPVFQHAGFEPDIMVESSFNGFLEQLTSQGICCTIIPESQVSDRQNVAWFYLEDQPRFCFSVAKAHDYALNNALRYFVQLAREDAKKHLDFPPPQS